MIASFDDFDFDGEQLELRQAGAPVKADTLLLRLLGALLRRPGELITKRQLLADVWGNRALSDNALSVSISRLRKLVGHAQSGHEVIVNVHGRGYRFVRPVTPRDTHRGPVNAAPVQPVHLGPPFVGRERVLQSLREALEAAQAGHGSVCILSGEPGIGKTRVVEIAGHDATALGLPVAWGRCREVGDTPALWPLAQLLREVLAALPLQLQQDRRFVRVRPELERLLPELAVAATTKPERGPYDLPASKYRLFDAISSVLTLASETSPCFLILDDLHRADPTSLEFLRYFVDEVASTRAVLVATMRRGENHDVSLDYVLGHRNTRRLSLQALEEDEVASYVNALCGQPDAALARALFDKSEGNPFFMTELARQYLEHETADLRTLRVPDAALDLIRQRVALLDEAARGALSHAAVIGRHFSLTMLQTVTGRDARTLMTNLDRALASELVVAERESTTTFAFSHELQRAVLYDALQPSERRECHLLVAQVLEQRMAAGESVPAFDLAYHYRSALPAGDPRKTVDHSSRAARDAIHMCAYADGLRYLHHARHALELLDHPNTVLRLKIMLDQAILARAHVFAEFEPLVREIIACARAQKLGVQLARAALLLDPYRGFPGRGSRALLEEALTLLPDSELGPRAAVLARLASTPPLSYDGARALPLLEEARGLAEASTWDFAQYSARMAELYLTGGPNYRRAAAQTMREIENLCRSPSMQLTSQLVLLEAHRAIAALQDGQLAVMDAALERGEARSRELEGDLLWQFKRWRALTQLEAGGYDELDKHEEQAEALRELHRRQRPTSTAYASELMCAYDLCVVLEEPDALPRRSLLEQFAPVADDPPNVWALKVRALCAAKLTIEARDQLALVPASALAALPCDRDYLGTLGALARAALALDAVDYIEALVPLLEPYSQHFAANVTFWCEGSVLELLGLLVWRLGEHAASLDLLQRGVALSERAGLLTSAARARVELEARRAQLEHRTRPWPALTASPASAVMAPPPSRNPA